MLEGAWLRGAGREGWGGAPAGGWGELTMSRMRDSVLGQGRGNATWGGAPAPLQHGARQCHTRRAGTADVLRVKGSKSGDVAGRCGWVRVEAGLWLGKKQFRVRVRVEHPICAVCSASYSCEEWVAHSLAAGDGEGSARGSGGRGKT